MATIDQLDIKVYVDYARFTRSVELTEKTFHLGEAGFIPPQTAVPEYKPTLTEMELLLGIMPRYTPWAVFFPYSKFKFHRRPAFNKFRTATSMGSLEKQEADYAKLSSIKPDDEEEEKEKEILCECFEEIEEINGWISYIVGRMGQYLQG